MMVGPVRNLNNDASSVLQQKLDLVLSNHESQRREIQNIMSNQQQINEELKELRVFKEIKAISEQN